MTYFYRGLTVLLVLRLYVRAGNFGPFSNEPPSPFVERSTYLFLLLGLGALGLILIAASIIGGIIMIIGMIIAVWGRFTNKRQSNDSDGTMSFATATLGAGFYLWQGGGFAVYLIGFIVTVTLGSRIPSA